MFELPGSTWQDYDQAVISPGGGVFRRTAKDIPLGSEVRVWLGVRYPSIDGEALIRLLLTAPVDLLWLGGVGTYIKASSESHEDVGDRANDSVRVDALQLRAKVAGEGANLGFTHPARIEYALNGGCINTDAVDNSGGVDLSDHEVNLKTLMTLLRRRGVIAADDDERNRFLAELTDDVCRSVLANNYRQSLCLSLEHERCLKDVEPFSELADQLENAGLLERTAESFPARKEIQARAGQGLTRPELAVLMAYAKLALKQTLLEAPEFLSAEWTEDFLAAYFPVAVRSHYAAYLRDHSLGREITATMICNRVINQGGAGLLVWNDGLDAGLLTKVVGAYLAFDQILEGDRLREQVFALDGELTTGRQYELLLQLEDALAFLSRWALRRGQQFLPEPALIGDWRTDLRQYLDHLVESLSDTERPQFDERLAELAALSFSVPEAHRLAFLDRLRDFPVLVDLSRRSREALRPVAKLADAVMEFFGLRHVVARLAEVKARDRWEGQLQMILEDRLRYGGARLSWMMLRTGLREPAVFFGQCGMQQRLAKFRRLRQEFHETPPVTLAPFAVLGGELDALIDACDAPSGYG